MQLATTKPANILITFEHIGSQMSRLGIC